MSDRIREEVERRLERIKQDPELFEPYDIDGNGMLDADELERLEQILLSEVRTEFERESGGESDSEPPPSSSAGTVLQKRFELLEELGRGGQAITHLARDRQSGEKVAVKQMLISRVDEWKSVELFEREGRILSQLEHKAIPHYVDTFHLSEGAEEQLGFYIVQEYVEGETLQQGIDTERRFTEEQARSLVRDVLVILDYLHRLNPPVIHRDIKPSNLIRRKDETIALIDFGAIQGAIATATTVGSTVVGTSGYMAPEQFMGRAEPATDLYALGATVVHLLSHRHPADLRMVRMRLKYHETVRISRPFQELLDRLLEPVAEDRFQSAREALEALDGLEPPDGPVDSSKPEPTTSGRAQASDRAVDHRPGGMNTAKIVLVALLGLGAAGGIARLLADRDAAPPVASVAPPSKGGLVAAPSSSSERRWPDPSVEIPAVDSDGRAIVPVEFETAESFRGLRLVPTKSGIRRYSGLSTWYTMIAAVHNGSRIELGEVRARVELLGPDGKLLDSESETLVDSSNPPVRPGDMIFVKFLLRDVNLDAELVRVTVSRGEVNTPTDPYPPSKPIELVWKVDKPQGVELEVRQRSVEQRQTSDGQWLHQVAVEISNRGDRPIEKLELTTRYLDGGGKVVHTDQDQVVDDDDHPRLQPGQTLLDELVAFTAKQSSSYRVQVTEIATASEQP